MAEQEVINAAMATIMSYPDRCCPRAWLTPSHGFDFCGISGLAFSKTRSLFLYLRANRIFMNNVHKMLPWGYRNSWCQGLVTPASLNLVKSLSLGFFRNKTETHLLSRLRGAWAGERTRVGRKLSGTEEKPQPTLRCLHGSGIFSLVRKSKWIPPAVAHTPSLAKQHTQGIEPKGSQLPLLILYEAFRCFCTWPFTTLQL